jgi:hypothetical protein
MLKCITINSGFNVSGDLDLRQHEIKAIHCPVVTSGFLAFQGNHDTTSANFQRLLDVRGQQGSGDLRFPIGAGSLSLPWPAVIPQPAFGRLEVINAGSLQADTRTFVLSLQPR